MVSVIVSISNVNFGGSGRDIGISVTRQQGFLTPVAVGGTSIRNEDSGSYKYIDQPETTSEITYVVTIRDNSISGFTVGNGRITIRSV